MDKKEKKLYKAKTTKDLMWGMALYTGSSVFGPLIIFGFLGYLVDSFFDTKPIFLIAGVLLAFVVTNILIFRKLSKLNKEIEKEIEEEKKKKDDKKEELDKNNDENGENEIGN